MGKENLKNVNLELVQATHRHTDLQTTRFYAAPYRTENGNLRKFGATYGYGTMFAHKQSLCQM